MKALKLSAWFIISLSILMFTACGGGGSDGSSGTVSMSITDAKPVLPEGTENLWITFEEVLVHKAGGGWISLPLSETPYTIDLLQFHDGNTTEFVPPVSLESGKYTQIRIVVSEATIRINDGVDVNDYSVTIPSENLKTNKNFSFDVQGGGAVDITIDFDLSQSIVVTDDGSGTLSYKLKPVLHIVDTFEAATITGIIANDCYIDDQEALLVTVSVCDNNFSSCETYTQLNVSKVSNENTTTFSIFWLVPNQNFRVEIDFDLDNSSDWDENVSADDLSAGVIFSLEEENTIICQDWFQYSKIF
jgi:hypothetical protein